MSVGAVSSISYTPYVYPTHTAAGAEEAFSVDPSALRVEEAAGAEAVERPEANTFVDPADAAKFSRDFPQILMQQAFAAPMPETQAPSATSESGDVSLNYLWQGDSSRTVLATEAAVEESSETAAPEDGNDEETGGVAGMGQNGEDEAAQARLNQETDAQGEPLSEEQSQQLQELKNRDREVRAHEQAHQSAGGQYAGGASYEYQQGPDGQRYAVGGEVSIDISAESDPEATIAKMRVVRAAAMAPAEPSSQDRSVAASAQATEMDARSELAEAQAAQSASQPGNAEQTDGQEGEGAGTVAEASGTTSTRPDAESVPSGGAAGGSSASLRSNAFESAYRVAGAESAYGSRMMSDPIMASAMAYRPIDIVA